MFAESLSLSLSLRRDFVTKAENRACNAIIVYWRRIDCCYFLLTKDFRVILVKKVEILGQKFLDEFAAIQPETWVNFIVMLRLSGWQPYEKEEFFRLLETKKKNKRDDRC